MTGDFAIVLGSNTCGSSLGCGYGVSVQVVFAPNAAAARTGTFTATDNAASSPQSLQLTGTGVDFALTANGSTTQPSSAGVEAVYPLLLSSAAGVPGTVAFACSGVPAYATCVVSPSSPALGGTATITVTVATSVASLSWPQHPGGQTQTWLALLLPLWLLGLGRRRGLGPGRDTVLRLSGRRMRRVADNSTDDLGRRDDYESNAKRNLYHRRLREQCRPHPQRQSDTDRAVGALTTLRATACPRGPESRS